MLKYDAQNYAPSWLRFLVLLYPQTPAKALSDNCRSKAWLERYAIAQNSTILLNTLHTLAAAAKANLQSRHQQP